MKRIPTKDFKNFNARTYLGSYNDSGQGHDNREILKALIKEYEGVSEGSVLLELGGGPTIYQLITSAKLVKYIYFSDFSPKSLREVQMWLSSDPRAWDWDGFIKTVLKLEGFTSPSKEDIEERKSLIKSKVKSILKCDVREKNPLFDDRFLGYFDIVALNFVLDSITEDVKEWEGYLKNSSRLVKSKGRLILNSISDVNFGWEIGDNLFVGCDIKPETLRKTLKSLGFEVKYLEKVMSEDCRGHDSHTFCMAEKC